MTNWIQTKAGLQMAETIIRYLPRIANVLENNDKQDILDIIKNILNNAEDMEKRIEELETTLKGYQPGFNNKNEIISDLRVQLNKTYGTDILKLIDKMDERKQENINLSYRVKELETMLKGYQPQYNK